MNKKLNLILGLGIAVFLLFVINTNSFAKIEYEQSRVVDRTDKYELQQTVDRWFWYFQMTVQRFVPKPAPVDRYVPKPAPVDRFVPKPEPVNRFVPKPQPVN